MLLVAVLSTVFLNVIAEYPTGCGEIGGKILEQTQKGYQNTRFKRVIGGDDINVTDAPWIVRIDEYGIYGEIQKCTGSLITKRHVIAAAHCFTDYSYGCSSIDKSMFSICHLINDNNYQCPTNQAYKIKEIHYPANYHAFGCQKSGDLAIVELEEEIENSVPICLPYQSNGIYSFGTYINDVFYVGYSDNRGNSTGGLLNTRLRFVNAGKPQYCYEYFLCTEYRNTAALCNGDSGGPMFEIIENRAVLIGVNTMTDGHCNIDVVQPNSAHPLQLSVDLLPHMYEIARIIAM